jgi:hypothetical protein
MRTLPFCLALTTLAASAGEIVKVKGSKGGQIYFPCLAFGLP